MSSNTQYVYTKGVGWHTVQYWEVVDADDYKYRMEFRKPEVGEFFFFLKCYNSPSTDFIDRYGVPSIELCKKHAAICRYRTNLSPKYDESYFNEPCRFFMTLVPIDT